MDERPELTEFFVECLTDAVLSALNEILVRGSLLTTNKETGMLEAPKEIADAVRAIEINLGCLNNFTAR